MLLITDLSDIPTFDRPCGLTIGSFDGVHLGHQALLKHLRTKLPSNSILSILTFSNHPSHLFTPHSPTLLISPPLQKVKHFENYGADLVVLIPFDAAFAGTTFEKFLKQMKQRLGFSYLSLGEGATFGKNKEGNEANVKLLAKEIGFEVDYLPKYLVNGTPVSSGRIRALIAQGKFSEIQECLGRPYSLMGRLIESHGHYLLHFPGVCLPPDGTYPIRLKTSSQTLQGSARVEQKEQKIRLDLLEHRIPLAGKDSEIIF